MPIVKYVQRRVSREIGENAGLNEAFLDAVDEMFREDGVRFIPRYRTSDGRMIPTSTVVSDIRAHYDDRRNPQARVIARQVYSFLKVLYMEEFSSRGTLS